MEVILLSKEEYQNIVDALNEIKLQIASFKKNFKDVVLDNQEFIIQMKISKRTAQSWRDAGMITFSQVGNKIYYNVADIEEMLRKHLRKSFKK